MNEHTPPGGPPLGPFYELENSSPAAALARGETMQYEQRTIHIKDTEELPDPIARRMLGVGLETIKSAFSK